MSGIAAAQLIVETLKAEGVKAREQDGWVYVTLKDGRELWIGAEYGQSLDAVVTDF